MEQLDLVKNFETLLGKAELGDADAQYGVGLCFMQGAGVRANRAKAVYWGRRAAAQGHVRARARLQELRLF